MKPATPVIAQRKPGVPASAAPMEVGASITASRRSGLPP